MGRTGGADVMALEHGAEMDVLAEGSKQRLFVPEILCPFAPEEPAVADDVDELQLPVHGFPSHARFFRLQFRSGEMAQTDGPAERLLFVHVVETVLQPALSGKRVVIEDTNVLALHGRCEGKAGNNAEIMIAEDFLDILRVPEVGALLHVEKPLFRRRVVVPENDIKGLDGLIEDPFHLFLEIMRPRPGGQDDGDFWFHRRSDFRHWNFSKATTESRERYYQIFTKYQSYNSRKSPAVLRFLMKGLFHSGSFANHVIRGLNNSGAVIYLRADDAIPFAKRKNRNMVKVVSGFSYPAGSTVALVNLCNQFNSRGYDCIFYGPDRWHLDKCRSEKISDFFPEKGDIVIIHHIRLFSPAELFRLPEAIERLRRKTRVDILKEVIIRNLPGRRRIEGVKLILTCPDNDLFPIRRAKDSLFQGIHFADELQAGDPGIRRNDFVCPNFADALAVSPAKPDRVAGIIGSIRQENQIKSAVEKALADGMETVIIYGYMLDPVYYYSRVQPLSQQYPGRIKYAGFVDDKQRMYDSISDVYRTVSKPCSLVQRECRMTGTRYHGPDLHGDDFMSNDRIFAVWKNGLGL